MFTSAVDEYAHALLQIHWPGPFHEASFRRALATLTHLSRVPDRRLRVVVQVSDGASPLSPQQRKAVSDTNRAATRAAIAVISKSPIHRGIVTALSWMDSSMRGRLTACASFDDACRWHQETSGEDSAIFKRLLGEAERNGTRHVG